MTEPSIRPSRESILLRSEPAKLSPSQELHSRAIEGSAKLKCRLTVEERGSRPRSNRGCRLTRGCSGTSNGPPNKQVNIFLSGGRPRAAGSCRRPRQRLPLPAVHRVITRSRCVRESPTRKSAKKVRQESPTRKSDKL